MGFTTVLLQVVKKYFTHFTAIMFCCVSSAYAVDSMTFTASRITAADWSLKNVVLSVTQLDQTPQISLLSASLILPPPLQNITSLNIQCQQFEWQENFLDCSAGHARFDAEQFKTLSFDFSLQIKNDKTRIKMNSFSFMGGTISAEAQELNEKWQVQIKVKNINLDPLSSLFSLDVVEITQGVADVEIELTGKQSSVKTLHVSALLKKLSVQDHDGAVASENITLKTEFSAHKQQAGWQWDSASRILEGGLYVEPVYMQVDDSSNLAVIAAGYWQAEQQKIQVDILEMEHAGILKLQANAILNYHAGISIEEARLSVQAPELKSSAPIYLLPFLESGPLAGLDLAGRLDAQLSISQDSLLEANIMLNNLSLDATQNDLVIKQANAQINWAKYQGSAQASYINWQHLKIQAIPFQAGQLDFISFDQQIKLLKTADLAFLGGVLSVNNFSFSAAVNNSDATVHFDGAINNVSLEQLTAALNWTPLTGTISGHIPSVRYQDKTLSLDGELKMQVFDGEIIIKNLASSGLFSDLPQFTTDIEFDHLDLGEMTQTFHTGYIEGRLSGSVQKLYLENWQPVSFYAWIGTPEDDNSTHRISQKAVENIASIGGGGAADVLSKGFLGLFSTFGYKKLGFGCYLHQGVCQLMGVDAVNNGFYLIKGGGLPRIDVIGYNPRLDWNVLISRLKRITASDEAIIE